MIPDGDCHACQNHTCKKLSVIEVRRLQLLDTLAPQGNVVRPAQPPLNLPWRFFASNAEDFCKIVFR